MTFWTSSVSHAILRKLKDWGALHIQKATDKFSGHNRNIIVTDKKFIEKIENLDPVIEVKSEYKNQIIKMEL